MKPKNSSVFTLEEILTLTNDELVSNWTKLASLVRAYEGIEWEVAKRKALDMLKDDEAVQYITRVRIRVNQKAHGIPETPKAEQPISKPAASKSEENEPKIKPFVIKPRNHRTMFEMNYVRLMKLAPGLEEKLLNFNPASHEYIHGKSESSTYMDWSLEVLDHDKSGFYIAISHYYIQNGDMVPDPDMEILVNVENKTVEALHFQDWRHYVEVYDDKRKRKMVNTREKNSQNRFLKDWFRNLKHQGHSIEWTEDDSPSTPHSEIIDRYKKEEKQLESTLRIVPPEEPIKKEEPQKPDESPKLDEPAPHEPPKSAKAKGDLEELEQAKIIPLNAGYTEQERQESVEQFIRVLTLNNKKDFKNIAFEALKIINENKTVPFLLDAWNKLKQSDHNHLMELNYFRLNAIVPNLLETLAREGGTIRLVSEKTKTAFRIELGDERKENVVILGIYQMNKKKPEPTLLVKIQKDKGTITTDLSTGSFAGLRDFNADETSRFFEPHYEAALGFERWLKVLVLQQFKPILVKLQKVGEEPAAETPKAEEAPKEPHSKYYINKDIPHMEPGHGWLTEAHKKHGVTQQMIDWINEHDKPLVIIPRKKAMIYNTVDKQADLSKQALQPGLRLSRHFLFYPEARSNRADRTRDGY